MKENNEMQKHIESVLGIAHARSKWQVSYEDFNFDLYLKDEVVGTRYVIDIKQRGSLEALAYLNLVREHYRHLNRGSECIFALAARSISPRLRELANEFDIRILDIPLTLVGNSDSRGASAATKITAPKTWNLVAAFIKSGPSSIRALAISENVSYAWAHRVITSLVEQGAAGGIGRRIQVTDVGRILNGVAWERPLGGLVRREFSVSNASVMSLAEELTASFSRDRQKIAFCGYLAGTLHTGAGMRHDLVQVYLPENVHEDMERMFRGNKGGSVKMQILAPDRDVFSSSTLIEGVSITSRRQTLLDVAGLGYGGMEMANALVREHDRL